MNKPELAGRIDGAMLNGDITSEEADLAHQYRIKNYPACFGNYDFRKTDCQRQDIIPCQLCRRIVGS